MNYYNISVYGQNSHRTKTAFVQEEYIRNEYGLHFFVCFGGVSYFDVLIKKTTIQLFLFLNVKKNPLPLAELRKVGAKKAVALHFFL